MGSKNLNRILLTLGLVIGTAGTAAAQDTTQAPGRSQRHVVQLGETLWGIAQLYLGDPFLWPEIYRLNTMVVEDPHWIFPGEELMLSAADATQVAAVPPPAPAPEAAQPETVVTPPRDTLAVEQQAAARPVEVAMPAEMPVAAPPVAPAGATIFARTTQATDATPVVVGPTERYRGVRAGDFYRSGFLTEGEVLPLGQVEGLADLGTPRGTTRSGPASAMIFQEIRLRAPEGASYQVGDSLLTVRIGREVQGGWGQIVVPTGVVRVVSASGAEAVGQVIEQFDRVYAGQNVLPVEPYPRATGMRPQRVTGGIEGLIIARLRTSNVPIQDDIVFIDLGRNVGVTPGDRFEVLATPEMVREYSAAGPQVLAEIEIVHVRERSATGVLKEIFTPGIRIAAGRNAAGAPVRLVAKMPA